MPRLLRLLFASLGAVCLLTAPGTAFAVSMDVLKFNVLVDISTEDRIRVTEEITVNVPTSGTNRGMFRDIPINPRWRDKGRRNVQLTVRGVFIDGKPHPIDDVSRSWPFLRIYMRDMNAYLSAGVHKFILQYDMTQQIGFFEKQDELTWNVTGSGWNGIGSSMCAVLPPEGAEFTDLRAWIGQRGERNSPVTTSFVERGGRKAILFKADRSLWPGEDFTVAVAWPKGITAPPPSLSPEEEHKFTYGLLALLANVAVVSFLIWYACGRDPKTGPAIPVFYPPKSPERLRRKQGRQDERLSAAAVNYLWNKQELTPRGIAALFISLAERGDYELKGDAKQGFDVIRLRPASSPIPEEQAAAGKLLEGTHVDNSSGYELSLIRNACVRALDRDYKKQWKQNVLPSIIAFIPAVIGLYYLVRTNLGPVEEWPGELWLYAIVTVILMAVCFIGVRIIRNLVLGIRRGRSFLALLVFLPVAAFLSLGLYECMQEEDLSWFLSPVQAALMVAVLLVPAFFAKIMDAPSLEMAKLRQEIAGLAMYIGAAEADRLNFANPPDKPLELYHRLLPYAVALGLEKAWGDRFAEELASIDMREGVAADILTEVTMLNTMVSSMDRSIAVYAAAQAAKTFASAVSSGSSFGGGGGGAGSGGGGGGGGAC